MSFVAKGIARTGLALIFGAMSLFHGTVMSFANQSASAKQLHHAESLMQSPPHTQVHRHLAGNESQPTPVLPDGVPSCYGVGCFVAMELLANPVSAASLQSIEILYSSAGTVMLSAVVDPSVPPPRLQV